MSGILSAYLAYSIMLGLLGYHTRTLLGDIANLRADLASLADSNQSDED